MSQMPDIKPIVNKEPERDKKKAGFLARLFGGGGAGGFGGLGGAGSAGGGMGGLAGGGLLATKAGLLAMILVGTTVAGGIGMVGYRLFGPGADMTGNGDNLQLFAPKPKEKANADGQGGARGDGSSESLSMLSQGNATPKAADASAAAPVQDATAGSATGSEAAASSGGGGPINKMGNGGNGVSKGLLKNSAKFGTLSGPNGAGGGGGAPVANSAPAKQPFDASAAAKGTLSGFRKSAAATIGGGSARSIAGKHFGSAGKQAFGVLANQKGAQSSYAAGQTYDGAASGGSNIGANGTPIGGSGAAPGTGPAQPKTLAAPSTDTNNSTNIPTPGATPMAPWQNSIKTAQMLLALGGVILFAMSKLGKGYPAIYMAMNIIVGVIGAAIIAIGAQVSGGQYGQKLQGGVLAAAGTGLIIAAAMAAAENPNNAAGSSTPGSSAPGSSAPASSAPASSAPGSSAGAAKDATDKPWGIDPYVLVGGGAVLIGVAGTMMVPLKKYPSTDFQNGNPPDSHWFGYRELPSESALKKMIA